MAITSHTTGARQVLAEKAVRTGWHLGGCANGTAALFGAAIAAARTEMGCARGEAAPPGPDQ